MIESEHNINHATDMNSKSQGLFSPINNFMLGLTPTHFAKSCIIKPRERLSSMADIEREIVLKTATK